MVRTLFFAIAFLFFAVQPAEAQLFRGRRGGSCSSGSCGGQAQAGCQAELIPAPAGAACQTTRTTVVLYQTQEPPMASGGCGARRGGLFHGHERRVARRMGRRGSCR